MENLLEALISAYNIKPKQLSKKLKNPKQTLSNIKQSSSTNTLKLNSNKVHLKKLNSNNTRKQHTSSVQPNQRAGSELTHYNKDKLRRNSSLDEDITKLENLTVRNSNARLDLVSIQERMIELGLRSLKPIAEIDESRNEDNLNHHSSIDNYLMKLSSRQEVKHKMSLKHLLAL